MRKEIWNEVYDRIDGRRYDDVDEKKYERDIVKIDDLELHYKGEVAFRDGGFKDNYYNYDLPIREYKIEVIGNIYENPELLK